MARTDIYNQEKFKQAILFEDLRHDINDKRTGTDIDFEYEDGKVWIKAEVKEFGKDITVGQRILFERFCNNMSNYKTYGVLLWHEAPPNEDIKLKDTIVVKVYYAGRWHDTYNIRGRIDFKTIFNQLAL